MRSCSTSRAASPKRGVYPYYDDDPRFVRAAWHVVANAPMPGSIDRVAVNHQQMGDALGSRPALDPVRVLAANDSTGWQCLAPWGNLYAKAAVAVNSGALQRICASTRSFAALRTRERPRICQESAACRADTVARRKTLRAGADVARRTGTQIVDVFRWRPCDFGSIGHHAEISRRR